ncbi:hypothetical protein TRIUR3_08623 [Triticum urartu]|uniref:Uncharacterized protein n=1 Tax=Triticum urartu TaxID=4572 RepID=M7YQ01_TRIUA|nr:hypothetical protein TRIUR3_08623 [Triticum urartu]
MPSIIPRRLRVPRVLHRRQRRVVGEAVGDVKHPRAFRPVLVLAGRRRRRGPAWGPAPRRRSMLGVEEYVQREVVRVGGHKDAEPHRRVAHMGQRLLWRCECVRCVITVDRGRRWCKTHVTTIVASPWADGRSGLPRAHTVAVVRGRRFQLRQRPSPPRGTWSGNRRGRLSKKNALVDGHSPAHICSLTGKELTSAFRCLSRLMMLTSETSSFHPCTPLDPLPLCLACKSID